MKVIPTPYTEYEENDVYRITEKIVEENEILMRAGVSRASSDTVLCQFVTKEKMQSHQPILYAVVDLEQRKDELSFSIEEEEAPSQPFKNGIDKYNVLANIFINIAKYELFDGFNDWSKNIQEEFPNASHQNLVDTYQFISFLSMSMMDMIGEIEYKRMTEEVKWSRYFRNKFMVQK